ncbi:hypothetical protein T09_56, partial [Trichinella sp. T9]
LNDTIPGRSERGHNHISYYQWVPFIPGVQELFFIQAVGGMMKVHKPTSLPHILQRFAIIKKFLNVIFCVFLAENLSKS